ncbi:MAG: hypothetical protein J0H49_28880 [Acidobacteria bacterium]|nr:hypothetical protein [Acidobacteriota bacterium]
MQNRLAFLRLIGFALLAGLAIWIGASVMHGVGREAPRLLDDSHAFEGNAQLPAAEIQKQLTEARERMDARYQYSQWTRYAGMAGDWLAFLLTAVITLIAGYHGRVLAVGAPDPAKIADLVKDQSARFTRTVGLVAAAAAICTALSAKAKDVSDGFYNDASAIQAAAMNARRDLVKASDASSAQDILDQLKQNLAKH